MKTIVVDLVIVYLRTKQSIQSIQKIKFIIHLCYAILRCQLCHTHNEIVTNSSPQLEKPISMPAAMPVGPNFRNDFLKSMCTRVFPVKHLYMIRITAEMTSFNSKWYKTTANGKWKF